MPLLTFASPKGGVGKTTLAANVANELSRAGCRVIALDLDPQNALRLHFGLPLRERAGFTHRLAQSPDWRGCLQETPAGIPLLAYGGAGLHETVALHAAVTARPSLLLDPVRDILANPDVYLVADTAPGPSSLLEALLSCTDLLVTVLLTDAASVSLIPSLEHGGLLASEWAARANVPSRFVLNQFDPRTRLGGVIFDAARQHLGERLLGVVYRDEHVAEAIAAQKLLADYAPSAKATHDVAAIAQRVLADLRSGNDTEPDSPAVQP
jgi:cellulose synthase operon protein YhjQ